MREGVVAQLHDRALAELLLDLAHREIDGPLAIHVDSHVTPSPAPGCRRLMARTVLPSPMWLQPRPYLAPVPFRPRRRRAGGRRGLRTPIRCGGDGCDRAPRGTRSTCRTSRARRQRARAPAGRTRAATARARA